MIHIFKSGPHRQRYGLLPHCVPEEFHILAQAPENKKRAISYPGGKWGIRRSRNKRIGTCLGIAKYKLTRPDEVLAGIAVQPRLGNLRRIDVAVSYEVIVSAGGPSPYARLRNTIVEAEVLVAALFPFQDISIFPVGDGDTSLVKLRNDRVGMFFHSFPMIAGDHHERIQLGALAAYNPVRGIAVGAWVCRVTEQWRPRDEPCLKSLTLNQRCAGRKANKTRKRKSDSHQYLSLLNFRMLNFRILNFRMLALSLPATDAKGAPVVEGVGGG